MRYIPEFNNRYLISESGEVFCTKKCKFINPHFCGVKRRNYYQITLYYEGKKFTKRVHSWMAITYLDFKYGDRKIVVDHIDNNPLNNHLSNLQIISMDEPCVEQAKEIEEKEKGLEYIRGWYNGFNCR